ncbi:MAG: AAA family ATPase, partial [Bacteroidales bacterium]|nr:AAA family ATPase [Bacteroidales bacterium]
LYIGKFISEYEKQKGDGHKIPVSCFTATAKQKVIQDISDYFEKWLGVHLELFASSATRTNLRYSVIHSETKEDKYQKLRQLIIESDCPTIVYVSRVRRTHEIADKLIRDGFQALPFNGKMDADEKTANQDAFMNGNAQIIVATSAFGMGVDKKDVGLVVHFDISDSLENYVQEAGRAGRDPELQARCYVLYSDNDLDKHFILLNQTKISISEIQQVWKVVKDMTKQRSRFECSALEIARRAGWDDSVSEIEMRVKTALSALEQGGYIERGNNIPHVYATGITVANMDEARSRIESSSLFEEKEVEKAVRIIKSLISQKYITRAQDAEAESRVDYLADILGLTKFEVVSAVDRMRQEGILADSRDISAYLQDPGTSQKKSAAGFERFAQLERFILEHIPDQVWNVSYKQLNDEAVKSGLASSTEKDIRTLLYFLTVKGYTRRQDANLNSVEIVRQSDLDTLISRFEKRVRICHFAIDWLYKQAAPVASADAGKLAVSFSIVELLKKFYEHEAYLLYGKADAHLGDIEEALLYLSRIGALKLEGGFLVLYNAMDIRRTKDARFRYRVDDYQMLNDFYKQKIQQIHIVGEYANLMVKDYDAALQYVQDYFKMDYKQFISKYFKGERAKEIQRNMTPEKYRQVFGELSPKQMDIISDKDSHCIVVAAGPGSGKTRVLVHKLASLLLLEDVKHEQLLMLTFSRAAATEFKQRLMDLIGNAAHFVEIKTFHSYCFDLLGRIGNLEEADDVVSKAAQMIENGEVEPNRISKTVLVIDEAQDMSADEYALVHALMVRNEEMRIIAVGDDDQNIFEFRGSDSKYLYQLTEVEGSRFVEMTENFRSGKAVVDFANTFSSRIQGRLKQTPIVSMCPWTGAVTIHRFSCPNMYIPLVRDLVSRPAGGKVGLLTQTNEEAVILLALLRSRGINAKMIQSADGFHFGALAEVRYFMRTLDSSVSTPIIPDDIWDMSKKRLFDKYASSSALPYLRRCLEVFENTNRKKYYTDFKEFIYESELEDFCETAGADVTVSTIHKSKGREYDEVYILLAGNFSLSNEQLRRYYVGMTRAKKNLHIYTNSSCFDRKNTSGQRLFDAEEYPLPDEVVLQLTHKDVVLSFFTSRKKDVLSLVGGDSLDYSEDYLLNTKSGKPVVKLSARMRDSLRLWEEKGYHVSSASVRFVVAWKEKDADQNQPETAVLLPELTLVKVG